MFAHEREADSIEHAQQLSTTRYFWWVTYLADLSGWDFLWEPVPWQSHQRHAWPNQHQPDSGVYLVPKNWNGEETNYHSAPVLHHGVDPNCWYIPDWIDANSIDTQWSPDPMDPPYIYEFPVEWGWDRIGGPQYRVPGANEIKYVNNFVTKTRHDSQHWFQHCNFIWTDEIYRWRPNPEDPPYIYVFGNQWYPAEVMPTVEYRVPGATEHKYMDLRVQLPERHDNHWHTLYDCEWDYSWVPDPGDPPYIYVFGNQHWSAEKMPTVEYHMPSATERKYMHMTARLLEDKTNWTIHEYIKRWDFSWVPDPGDPPYIYVWGNQHWPGEVMPTLTYTVPGATEIKYMDGPQPQLGSCMGNWEFCEDIDDSAWDWTWVPNPKDPPYIYVFGNQWNPPELKASLKYHVDGATEVKYMDRRARRLPHPDLFTNILPVVEFDYSWEPDPTDPPMTYVFGSQWNPGVLEAAVTCSTGGTEIKYVDNIIAKVAPNPESWTLLDDVIEFDYSWRPNPTDPPYIYVFGNQWLSPEVRPALEYHVGGATERKYMDYPRARRRGNPELFEQLYPCTFDWSWEPEPGSPPYIYVFGNQYYSAEVMPTLTYAVPGATEHKYMDIPAQLLPEYNDNWRTVVACTWDYTWRPEPGSPPYIYVFGNQWWPAEKMPTMEYHMLGATERKYMDIPAQLQPDMTHWRIPNHVEVKDMDFSWVPDPGEPPYIYQFATQHQKTGGPQYRVPGASEVKYVDMMRAEVKREAAPIFEIDHLDGNAGQIPNVVKKIRYFDNYRDTLIRLAKSLVGKYEHVWVCSSICDYSDFDFSWHPETWQSTMLHVFPSDEQKFGDTFYMHVPTFAERAEKKQLLEWYSVNYVPRRKVPRRPVPVIQHSEDSQVDAVKNTDWVGPLALFTTTDYVDQALATVSLWRQETKTIVPLSPGATSVIVPKSAKGDIRTQLYDYPYIDKTHRMLRDQPLDIVFISNGENEAEFLYQHLLDCVSAREHHRVHRVENVKGRVAAYHAAARASTTPWFFAVFAKLMVSGDFDWSWQPDRMQQPKHYIFHAENPINDLVYGHQAMIAYNKKLALENTGVGLDFTLDQPHEVVPILSGTANHYTDNWMCWRTAFREALKLRASLPDVENEYRLNQWLTVDKGSGQWSSKGAQDAVEFYDAVKGDPTELHKSYEWDWLASYAFIRRSLSAGR